MVSSVRISYRVGQFWRRLTAGPLPGLYKQEISAVLNNHEDAYFQQLSDDDQWHSYQVLQTLKAAGHTHPDLLSAALLHDIGKTRYHLTIWDRTLIVLVQVFFPGKAAKWGKAEITRWKRPFVIKAKHPEWGAKMAEMAGSFSLTISLIRRHQDNLPEIIESEEDKLLQYLQWADELN